MSKVYLAVFSLPKRQDEHLKIAQVIGACCGGDFKKAIIGSAMIFTYASDTPPHALDFGRVLFNGDEVLFVEVGDYVTSTGLGVLRGWLNSHGKR